VQPETRSAELTEFALGQLLGQVVDRDILYGELLTKSPRICSPVALRVTKVIEGEHSVGATVEIPYAALGISPRSRYAVAHAWENIQFPATEPVIVVLTRSKIGDFEPGDAILVTSRQREIEIVPTVLTEAAGLTSPKDLAIAVRSMNRNSSPGLAGYLFAHIWYWRAEKHPLLATDLFAKMIGAPGMPPETWEEIAGFIVLFYVFVPAETQNSIVQRFVELGLRQDRFAAFAGFRGLGQIATFASLKMVTDDSVDALTKAYRSLVTVEDMPREPR
jgi:hypothetical protein